MEHRKVLLFLLLVIYVIGIVTSFRNGPRGPDLIRHTRRISLNEYLVPPPPPKFPSRTGRLATPQPVEAPGYFTQLMSWLNPFGFGSLPQSSIPPPHPEASYSSSPKFIQQPPPTPVSPVKIYGDPSPLVYNRPPPRPPPIFNNPSEYSPPVKIKNCNPCNKVPWVPMQQNELSHSGDSSYIHPLSSLFNGGYLPPSNHEVAHDAYHAASQEIRAPDFSFAPPLPIAGQDVPLIEPILNPHLYHGLMPPLFNAKDFNYPVQPTLSGNSEYLNTLSTSISGNGPLTSGHDSLPENDSFPGPIGPIVKPNLNSEYNEQSVPSSHSDLRIINQGQGYINTGTNNGKLQHLQNHGAHSDLSSSGTQISNGHANSALGKQEFEDIATHQGSFNSISHPTSFDSSGALDHQASEISNNGRFYDVTGPISNGPLADFLNNSSQIEQSPPSSYGISGLGQISNNHEHRYNDLSSSDSISKNSHASLQTPDGTTKITDSIHFEESPLLDLTHKDESLTDSSSIPPTSNALVDFNESTGTTGTTLAPGDEIFGALQGIASTESHFFADQSQTIDFSGASEESRINNSATQNFNKSLHDSKALRDQEILYISSPSQAEYLWPNILSTTSRSTERESFFSTLVKSNGGIREEALDQSVNSKDKMVQQQGAKRNKQVQVIIPYTSQYTPLPFHPPNVQNYGKKLSHTDKSNRDNYISEESRNRFKVANLPDSSHTFQTWPTTLAILEDVARKSAGAKVNNSIDVHRLQKNIDNWTIQEYSRGTTASTVSPSSVNPYLFPSKQIPDEYLTTTESVSHTDYPSDDNVKTFALAGFSFNDLEHEGSASSRVEGSRVQVIQSGDSKSTDSSVETRTSTKDDITWQSFSVDISSANKERVYVVTPQSIVTTPKPYLAERKKEKAAKEAERNSKESTKASEIDASKPKEMTTTFESIEKAYQVLPQAVNNLAVASTGPENVPLWGIMEHEEFASLDDSESDNENSESSEIPVLYTGHSKVSRAKR